MKGELSLLSFRVHTPCQVMRFLILFFIRILEKKKVLKVSRTPATQHDKGGGRSREKLGELRV